VARRRPRRGRHLEGLTDSVNFMASKPDTRSEHRRGHDGRRQRRTVEEITVDVKAEILEPRTRSTRWSINSARLPRKSRCGAEVGTEEARGQGVVQARRHVEDLTETSTFGTPNETRCAIAESSPKWPTEIYAQAGLEPEEDRAAR